MYADVTKLIKIYAETTEPNTALLERLARATLSAKSTAA
jgi:hypothetical protein